jgi:tripartite-type tricarboxylate transporter receptor subunit TctC
MNLRKLTVACTRLIAIAACLVSGSAVHADVFPSAPIRIVIPSGAGGIIDPLARHLEDWFKRAWGQPVVVDYKAGAGGAIGTQLVAKSAPDGYTLLMANSGPLIWNPAINPKISYSMRDFVPVGTLVSVTNVLVVPSAVPATTLKEFIELARKNPGKLNYGSSGIGQSSHLAGEALKRLAGIDIVHVPFAGGPAALNGLLASQVQIMAANIGTALPFIKAGKLRALAVPDVARSETIADVPTTSEAGLPGLVISPYIWVAAPAGTPQEVVARLHEEMKKAWSTPEAQKLLQHFDMRMDADANQSLDSLHRGLNDENERWVKFIREAHLRQE